MLHCYTHHRYPFHFGCTGALATKRRESADSMCGSKGSYALGYVAVSALAAPPHPTPLAKCMKRMTDEWQQGKGTDGRHVSPPLVVDQH